MRTAVSFISLIVTLQVLCYVSSIRVESTELRKFSYFVTINDIMPACHSFFNTFLLCIRTTLIKISNYDFLL